ncbi:MAG: agmatine deiminase family protein [Bacteroidaceae bacterium]|nr:agmatine deiminase family protein [Bacteroidaceae bacterium]
MGLISNKPTAIKGDELQLTFGLTLDEITKKRIAFFPAEWYPQSGVQLTWPHANTDWKEMLEEVEECFTQIAAAITKQEIVVIVTPDIEQVKQRISPFVKMKNIRFVACDTNDTWARDHGAITTIEQQQPQLLDFCFNGWGMKFAANYDNQITRKAISQQRIKGHYHNHLQFILEGGSIESDGAGTLLTTKACLLSKNRNETYNQTTIEQTLKSLLHVDRVLWLEHGYLAGDDTDSHIDTLARFCPNNTILYVSCKDKEEEHYKELSLMEKELQQFRTREGAPYRLMALPMATAIYDGEERLPATYANFLVINNAVLYPTYQQIENDLQAKEVLQQAFPEREIIGIDCTALIKQHGALHCVTMQYPLHVID